MIRSIKKLTFLWIMTHIACCSVYSSDGDVLFEGKLVSSDCVVPISEGIEVRSGDDLVRIQPSTNDENRYYDDGSTVSN